MHTRFLSCDPKLWVQKWALQNEDVIMSLFYELDQSLFSSTVILISSPWSWRPIMETAQGLTLSNNKHISCTWRTGKILWCIMMIRLDRATIRLNACICIKIVNKKSTETLHTFFYFKMPRFIQCVSYIVLICSM